MNRRTFFHAAVAALPAAALPKAQPAVLLEPVRVVQTIQIGSLATVDGLRVEMMRAQRRIKGPL